MPKRARSPAPSTSGYPNKRKTTDGEVAETFNKVATYENATAVDENPPLRRLMTAMENGVKKPKKGQSVVYWMRMEDMRIEDNTALDLASQQAKRDNVPLVVLFVVSPQDYKAHDRGPRRIDFMLRNLAVLKHQFKLLHIPLHTIVHSPRKTLPEKVIEFVKDLKSKHIFANIEYEVDELRRDIKVHSLATDHAIHANFSHDRCVVEPGRLASQAGKPYSVYSPWLKSWVAVIGATPGVLLSAALPSANPSSTESTVSFSNLFSTPVPDSIPGFECHDREKMTELYPAGSEAAGQIVDRFFNTKARASQVGDASPLSNGAQTSTQDSRLNRYHEQRDRADIDSSSRISPYLASGVISARELVRRTMAAKGTTKIDAQKSSGVGTWVQEIAWRDFYTHVMAAFPRTSMGRPFQEKYADVQWEDNEDHLQAWKDGKTGIPIVDAAMRQLNTQGWMHNRCRMIVAMYLTKNLMIDWHHGEEYFMRQLVDADLSSNNGGWQWSASTGTDAQPYFRIFNPYNQAEKADPTGNYIRHFVPELKSLKGKAIYDPLSNMPKANFKKLGYPEPLVDHKVARERALRRFRDVGEL